MLGWREFMRHVHVATDGFRTLAKDAQPNALGAEVPLIPAFWGTPSGLHCLDHVVDEVWKTGYGHHITRLMILSNLATLLGLDPREVTDWFRGRLRRRLRLGRRTQCARDGHLRLGDLFVTKPYVSGAAYIHKMSDYCDACAFSPKKDCPITPLYWRFLARNAEKLEGNPRVAMPLRSLAKRKVEVRERDAAVERYVLETLGRGDRLRPEALP